MNEQVKKDFIKAISENPDLPIKVFISGECYEDENSWFVGEVYGCEVTEIVVYGDRVYTKDEDDVLEECIYDKIQEDTEAECLTVEEMEDMAKEELEWLGWERVILIKVEV